MEEMSSVLDMLNLTCKTAIWNYLGGSCIHERDLDRFGVNDIDVQNKVIRVDDIALSEDTE